MVAELDKLESILIKSGAECDTVPPDREVTSHSLPLHHAGRSWQRPLSMDPPSLHPTPDRSLRTPPRLSPQTYHVAVCSLHQQPSLLPRQTTALISFAHILRHQHFPPPTSSLHPPWPLLCFTQGTWSQNPPHQTSSSYVPQTNSGSDCQN